MIAALPRIAIRLLQKNQRTFFQQVNNKFRSKEELSNINIQPPALCNKMISISEQSKRVHLSKYIVALLKVAVANIRQNSESTKPFFGSKEMLPYIEQQLFHDENIVLDLCNELLEMKMEEQHGLRRQRVLEFLKETSLVIERYPAIQRLIQSVEQIQSIRCLRLVGVVHLLCERSLESYLKKLQPVTKNLSSQYFNQLIYQLVMNPFVAAQNVVQALFKNQKLGIIISFSISEYSLYAQIIKKYKLSVEPCIINIMETFYRNLPTLKKKVTKPELLMSIMQIHMVLTKYKFVENRRYNLGRADNQVIELLLEYLNIQKQPDISYLLRIYLMLSEQIYTKELLFDQFIKYLNNPFEPSQETLELFTILYTRIIQFFSHNYIILSNRALYDDTADYGNLTLKLLKLIIENVLHLHSPALLFEFHNRTIHLSWLFPQHETIVAITKLYIEKLDIQHLSLMQMANIVCLVTQNNIAGQFLPTVEALVQKTVSFPVEFIHLKLIYKFLDIASQQTLPKVVSYFHSHVYPYYVNRVTAHSGYVSSVQNSQYYLPILHRLALMGTDVEQLLQQPLIQFIAKDCRRWIDQDFFINILAFEHHSFRKLALPVLIAMTQRLSVFWAYNSYKRYSCFKMDKYQNQIIPLLKILLKEPLQVDRRQMLRTLQLMFMTVPNSLSNEYLFNLLITVGQDWVHYDDSLIQYLRELKFADEADMVKALKLIPHNIQNQQLQEFKKVKNEGLVLTLQETMAKRQSENMLEYLEKIFNSKNSCIVVEETLKSRNQKILGLLELVYQQISANCTTDNETGRITFKTQIDPSKYSSMINQIFEVDVRHPAGTFQKLEMLSVKKSFQKVELGNTKGMGLTNINILEHSERTVYEQLLNCLFFNESIHRVTRKFKVGRLMTEIVGLCIRNELLYMVVGNVILIRTKLGKEVYFITINQQYYKIGVLCCYQLESKNKPTYLLDQSEYLPVERFNSIIS